MDGGNSELDAKIPWTFDGISLGASFKMMYFSLCLHPPTGTNEVMRMIVARSLLQE